MQLRRQSNSQQKDAKIAALWQNRPMYRITHSLSTILFCSLIAACATAPRSELVTGSNTEECVVLLHGLNRSWRAMRPMADALQEAGFSTANVDYPSHSGTLEEMAPLAVDIGLNECRKAGALKIHFVTHSLGGILLRYQNHHSPIPDLGRVVMLGPPNQGSEVIDKTRDWPGFEILAGEVGAQLGTDVESVPSQLGPVDFELGVIAGTGSINPFTSAMLPNPDDGKVSVARTRIDGMDDFLIVGNSHHYLMRSHVVIRNTTSFLRDGKFLAEDKALMDE